MKEPVEIKKNIRLCSHPVELTIPERLTRYDCLRVYAHFFFRRLRQVHPGPRDRQDGILFCYAILNGDTRMSELGTTFLSDLRGDGRIKLDFHWSRCSLAEALYDRYPGDFPAPHLKQGCYRTNMNH